MIQLLRIFKTTLFLLTINNLAFGQEWQWVQSAGGHGSDVCEDIGVDAAGNSYVTGWFDETISFGNIKLINEDIDLAGASYDIFIAKYNASGQIVWVRKAGGVSSDRGHAIAVDAAGNSYITGSIQNEAAFGSTKLISSGLNSAFIAKYDTNGNSIWAVNTGGYYSEGLGIAIDAFGNSYITGWFQGTVNFGSTVLTSKEHEGKFFIAKYDANGKVVWVKDTIGHGQGTGFDLAVDAAGNCHVTGFFRGAVAFGAIPLQPKGAGDIFLAKYDPNGNVLWAKKASASSLHFAIGLDVALDADGNSFVTGRFRDKVTFEDKPLMSSGQEDIFLAKFDANGKIVWAKKAGGEGADAGHSIAVDTDGRITITGSFNQIVEFGTTTLISKGEDDIFVAQYDANGKATWAMQAGGLAVDGSLSQGNGIALDSKGGCYLAGSFGENATFGAEETLNQGSSDIYVAKISSRITPTIVLHPLLTTTFCAGSSLALPFTTTGWFDAGNSFTVQLSDAMGSFASPVAIGTGTISPIAITIPAVISAGSSYRMRIIASSPSISSDSNSINLTLTPQPTANAGANETVCATTSSFTLIGFSPTGGTWSGTGVNAAGVFTPSLVSVGSYTLTYTVQVGTCSTSSTKTITVSAPPVIMAEVKSTACDTEVQGAKIAPYMASFTNHTAGATGYLWEFGDGTTSTDATPTHLYNSEGTYNVFLTAYNGTYCSRKQEVTNILVEKKRPLPNIITPNGDGRNDAFVVQLSCSDLNLKVYNRTGQLVYERSNYQNTWQGENLADGTYYYQLSATNGLTWKGWIEIVR